MGDQPDRTDNPPESERTPRAPGSPSFSSAPQNLPASEDFDLLVEQYLAGTLSEDQAAILLSHLEHDLHAGRRLLDQVHLDAMLHEIADTPGGTGFGITRGISASTVAEDGNAPTLAAPGRRIQRWAAVAALIAVAAGAVWAIALRPTHRPPQVSAKPPVTQPAEAITASIAVLTRSVDARWQVEPGSSAAAPRTDGALEPGWLRLESGLAQIEFFHGAQVVLEGPAELKLVSASEAFCQSGKLRADVPPQARGFRIATPQADIIDRGTSVGVEVSPSAARVHVFEGAVELRSSPEAATAPAAASRVATLTQGQAATIDQAGGRREIALDPEAFATSEEIDRRLDESQRRWLVRWQEASVVANADSTLLIRFDFEGAEGSARVLANVAASAIDDAAIVGCGWAEGRWPGKSSLEYRGVGDRVRVEIDQPLQSITFAAWVRVHGLDRSYNSLFMSDAFNRGATHWQILRDGRVRLGVGAGKPQDIDSPVVFTPERLGQWIHLAVVYDDVARQVTHYVDGRPVSRSPMQPRPLLVGRAELGNWNPASRADGAPVRHFSGRIDEFWAYGRALSDEEIASMYAIGAGLTETATP